MKTILIIKSKEDKGIILDASNIKEIFIKKYTDEVIIIMCMKDSNTTYTLMRFKCDEESDRTLVALMWLAAINKSLTDIECDSIIFDDDKIKCIVDGRVDSLFNMYYNGISITAVDNELTEK